LGEIADDGANVPFLVENCTDHRGLSSPCIAHDTYNGACGLCKRFEINDGLQPFRACGVCSPALQWPLQAFKYSYTDADTLLKKLR
jgi:hypothetical protein